MKSKDKKTMATVGILAVVGLGAAVAAPSILGGGNGSSGGGGGGGSLGGFADPIDYGEPVWSFDDLMGMIPVAEPFIEEPSILDGPPNFPTPVPLTPEPATTQTKSLWTSFADALAGNGNATRSNLTNYAAANLFLSNPALAFSAAGAHVGFGLIQNGVERGQSMRSDLIDASRAYIAPKTGSIGKAGNSNPSPVKQSNSSQATTATKSGGSGFGSAKIVEAVKTVLTPPKKETSTGSGFGTGGIGGGAGGGGGGVR